MKSFTIKKLKKNLEIEEIDYNTHGFIYKTKNDNIKEINIINPEIISGLIIYNFNKKYKRILSLILLSDNEDDSSNGTLMLALDEIARLKNIMESKYYKLLKKKEAEKLHKKIMLTEKDIKNKLIDKEIKKEEKEQVEEKHKSR